MAVYTSSSLSLLLLIIFQFSPHQCNGILMAKTARCTNVEMQVNTGLFSCPLNKYLHGIRQRRDERNHLVVDLECCNLVSYRGDEFLQSTSGSVLESSAWYEREHEGDVAHEDHSKHGFAASGLACRGANCDSWKLGYTRPHFRHTLGLFVGEVYLDHDSMDTDGYKKCAEDEVITSIHSSGPDLIPACMKMEYFCPDNAAEAYENCRCMDGYLEEIVSSKNSETVKGCTKCPDGQFCILGVAHDCEPGTFCVGGDIHHCPVGTTSGSKASSCFPLNDGCFLPVEAGKNECLECYTDHYFDEDGSCIPLDFDMKMLKNGYYEIDFDLRSPDDLPSLNIELTTSLFNRVVNETEAAYEKNVTIKEAQRKYKEEHGKTVLNEQELKDIADSAGNSLQIINDYPPRDQEIAIHSVTGDGVLKNGKIVFPLAKLSKKYSVSVQLRAMHPGYKNLIWMRARRHHSSHKTRWLRKETTVECSCHLDGNNDPSGLEVKFFEHNLTTCLEWVDNSHCEKEYQIYYYHNETAATSIGNYSSNDCSFGGQCGSSIEESCGLIQNRRICHELWPEMYGKGQIVKYKLVTVPLDESAYHPSQFAEIEYTNSRYTFINITTNLLRFAPKARYSVDRKTARSQNIRFPVSEYHVDYNDPDIVIEDDQFLPEFDDDGNLLVFRRFLIGYEARDGNDGVNFFDFNFDPQRTFGPNNYYPMMCNNRNRHYLEQRPCGEFETHLSNEYKDYSAFYVYDYDSVIIKGWTFYNNSIIEAGTFDCPLASIKVCIQDKFGKGNKLCEMTNEHGYYELQVQKNNTYEISVEGYEAEHYYPSMDWSHPDLNNEDVNLKVADHKFVLKVGTRYPMGPYNFQFTKSNRVKLKISSSTCGSKMGGRFLIKTPNCPNFSYNLIIPAGTLENDALLPAFPEVESVFLKTEFSDEISNQVLSYFYKKIDNVHSFSLKDDAYSTTYYYPGEITVMFTVKDLVNPNPKQCSQNGNPYVYSGKQYEVLIEFLQHNPDGTRCRDFGDYTLMLENPKKNGGLCQTINADGKCEVNSVNMKNGYATFKIFADEPNFGGSLTRKVNVYLTTKGQGTIFKTFEAYVLGMIRTDLDKEALVNIPAYVPAFVLHAPPGDESFSVFPKDEVLELDFSITAFEGDFEVKLNSLPEYNHQHSNIQLNNCQNKRFCVSNAYEDINGQLTNTQKLIIKNQKDWKTSKEGGDLFLMLKMKLKMYRVEELKLDESNYNSYTLEEDSELFMEEAENSSEVCVPIVNKIFGWEFASEGYYDDDEILYSMTARELDEKLEKLVYELDLFEEQQENNSTESSNTVKILASDNAATQREFDILYELYTINEANKLDAMSYQPKLLQTGNHIENEDICFPDASTSHLEHIESNMIDCKDKGRTYSKFIEAVCTDGDIPDSCFWTSTKLHRYLCGDPVTCESIDPTRMNEIEGKRQSRNPFKTEYKEDGTTPVKTAEKIISEITFEGSSSGPDIYYSTRFQGEEYNTLIPLPFDTQDQKRIMQLNKDPQPISPEERTTDFYFQIKKIDAKTKFFLKDKDLGDKFELSIHVDPMYHTPVFQVLNGQSQCKHEAGTEPRRRFDFLLSDIRQYLLEDLDIENGENITFGDLIYSNSVEFDFVEPHDGKIVPFNITNHHNDQDVNMKLLITENRHLLNIKINSTISSFHHNSISSVTNDVSFDTPFTLKVNETKTIYVDFQVNPMTQALKLHSVILAAQSLCYDREDSIDMEKEMVVKISYYEPCDAANWMESSLLPANQDFLILSGVKLLPLHIKGRDESLFHFRSRVEKVVFEYRNIDQHSNWTQGEVTYSKVMNGNNTNGEFFRDEDGWDHPGLFDTDNVYTLFWDLENVTDGKYEFRTVTSCFVAGGADPELRISEIKKGTFSRTIPTLLDSGNFKRKTYYYGDHIQIDFDKYIDCDFPVKYRAKLSIINETTVWDYNQETVADSSTLLHSNCMLNFITITLSAEIDYPSIMGKKGKLQLCNVRDTFGNEIEECVEVALTFSTYLPREIQSISTEISLVLSSVEMVEVQALQLQVQEEFYALGFTDDYYEITTSHLDHENVFRQPNVLRDPFLLESSKILDKTKSSSLSIFNIDMKVKRSHKLEAFENMKHLKLLLKSKASSSFILKRYWRFQALPLGEVEIDYSIIHEVETTSSVPLPSLKIEANDPVIAPINNESLVQNEQNSHRSEQSSHHQNEDYEPVNGASSQQNNSNNEEDGNLKRMSILALSASVIGSVIFLCGVVLLVDKYFNFRLKQYVLPEKQGEAYDDLIDPTEYERDETAYEEEDAFVTEHEEIPMETVGLPAYEDNYMSVKPDIMIHECDLDAF